MWSGEHCRVPIAIVIMEMVLRSSVCPMVEGFNTEIWRNLVVKMATPATCGVVMSVRYTHSVDILSAPRAFVCYIWSVLRCL